MIDITHTYSSMGLSHIEGLEAMHSRFQLAVTGMKKKPYDILEYRRADFDQDFEEFKRQTWEIRVSQKLLKACERGWVGDYLKHCVSQNDLLV